MADPSTTPANVRTLLSMTIEDWADATLEGDLFIALGVKVISQAMSRKSISYDDLTDDHQAFVDMALAEWVCHRVCLAEASRAATTGTDAKMGPVTLKGISPENWEKQAKAHLREAGRWLGLIGVSLSTKAFGFKFTKGDFGDRTEHPLHTVPDENVMLSMESERAETD